MTKREALTLAKEYVDVRLTDFDLWHIIKRYTEYPNVPEYVLKQQLKVAPKFGIDVGVGG